MENRNERHGQEDAFEERMLGPEEDGMLMELAGIIEEEEARPALVDPARIAGMMEAFRLVTGALDGQEAEISVKMHEPFRSFGCISVTFRDLVITEPAGLGRAISLASNCEAYMRTDGSVCLSLGFHGLTRPTF